MPKITPARLEAHAPHPESEPPAGSGWCLPCYRADIYTLAADPTGELCVLHALDLHAAPSDPGDTSRPRRPRGRAAHPPSGRPPRRARTTRHVAARTAARARAKALAYGRRRAAARLTTGTYTPRPGWQHLINPEYRVLTNQAEALTVLTELLDDQDWRTDKHTAWAAILRQLVHAMDWDTGLICALTAARLAAAGNRSERTVSRVIAWARDTGLLVVVEHAASAEFLGTDHGRTPTYALVTDRPLPQPTPPAPSSVPAPSHPQLSLPVEENGDLPAPSVDKKPLNDRRLDQSTPRPNSWPVLGVPSSSAERTAATRCVLQRLGLDDQGVSGVPLWRIRALLRPWWAAGACPAALLWAIDHHPDHPTHHRGDALRAAHDPLRVLGHRLRPWQNRLAELPAHVVGILGDYQAAATRQVTVSRGGRGSSEDTVAATRTARAAARAAVIEHLNELRRRRSGRAEDRPSADHRAKPLGW